MKQGNHARTVEPRGVWVIVLATLLAIVGGALGATAFTGRDPATVDAATSRSAPPAAVTDVTPAVRPRPAPSEPPRPITVVFTGDVLPHSAVLSRALRSDGAYDFEPLLTGLRPALEDADLALCHLEVPLGREASNVSTYPVFNAPPSLASGLAAVGYDGCSVASNHSLDQGVDGVASTLDALDAADLGFVGTARTPKEDRRAWHYTVGDVELAHLSYTYGLNGFVLPADAPYLIDLIDDEAILRDAGRARRHGADFTVVSLHWGTEYDHDPTPDQRTLARRLLASDDIDLLVGHHAHVVQPLEVVDGKVVAYGLGNSLSNQSPDCCVAATQDGALLEVEVTPGDERPHVTEARIRPTFVVWPGRRVVLVDEALADDATSPELAEQLSASQKRTVDVLGNRPVRP